MTNECQETVISSEANARQSIIGLLFSGKLRAFLAITGVNYVH